jgi:uncharacterized membrane protein YukC
MRKGASDLLYNYQGEGLDFDQLMGFFVEQIREELQPFPDNTGDELDEDMKRINADLAKSAKEIEEAKDIAMTIYDRCKTEEDAAREMQAYEGNEWVPLIGMALEDNDYSRLAI